MLFGGNWRFTRKLAFTAPSSSRGWAGIRGGFRNGTGNVWEGLGGRLGADGDLVVRVKREVASRQHAGGEISHDRLGLEMKVAQHFIAAPAAEEADHVGVDMGAEEGHSAGGSKGAGGDICWNEAEVDTTGGGVETKEFGDCSRADGSEGLGAFSFSFVGFGWLVIEPEGRGVGGVVFAEMDDATGGSKDRAKGWMATAAQPDDFAPDTVLLGGEFEGDKGGIEEFGVGGRPRLDDGVADLEFDVADSEGRCVGRGGSVFSRSKEEEEGEADHVGDAFGGVGSTVDGGCHKVKENWDGDGFDAVGRRIFFGIGAEHTVDAEVDLAEGV